MKAPTTGQRTRPKGWIVSVRLDLPTLASSFDARGAVLRRLLELWARCPDRLSRAADTWAPLLRGQAVTFRPMDRRRAVATMDALRAVPGVALRSWRA